MFYIMHTIIYVYVCVYIYMHICIYNYLRVEHISQKRTKSFAERLWLEFRRDFESCPVHMGLESQQ